MKLKVGDWVRWISETRGVKLKRKGKVVYIVDPFTRLCEVINDNEFKNYVRRNFNIIYNKIDEYRTHVSYLVLTRDDGRIQSLYWPNVDLIKKIRKRKSKSKIKNKKRGD